MSGKGNRLKGIRGELEVAKLLQPVVNAVHAEFGLTAPLVERNIDQVRSGGCDVGTLHCLHWLALEVKRQETLAVPQWWRQAVSQASEGQVPVLLFRQNGKKVWRVILEAELPVGSERFYLPVEIGHAAFLHWFQARLRLELERGASNGQGTDG